MIHVHIHLVDDEKEPVEDFGVAMTVNGVTPTPEGVADILPLLLNDLGNGEY